MLHAHTYTHKCTYTEKNDGVLIGIIFQKCVSVSDSIKEKYSFSWFIDHRFLESAEPARFYLGDLRAWMITQKGKTKKGAARSVSTTLKMAGSARDDL